MHGKYYYLAFHTSITSSAVVGLATKKAARIARFTLLGKRYARRASISHIVSKKLVGWLDRTSAPSIFLSFIPSPPLLLSVPLLFCRVR